MDNHAPPIKEDVRERYERNLKLVKEQEDNLNDLKAEIRDNVIPKFKYIIGVFGSFSYAYSDNKTGEDVIDYVAAELSKRNPSSLVISGKAHYIYYENEGKVTKENLIQDALLEFVEEQHITSHGYSRLLACMCNLAVFLITPTRSTSFLEEAEFLANIFGRNILGIGVQIIETLTEYICSECGCCDVDQLEIESGKMCYHLKKIIKRGISDCSSIFRSITYGSVELYMSREFAKLVATKHWEIIPQIFMNFMSSILKT